MKEYVENMKKHEENMKEYEEIIMYERKYDEICGFGNYKNDATCESSYIHFFLHKGPGTWKNSKLSPYRFWDSEQFLASPPV